MDPLNVVSLMLRFSTLFTLAVFLGVYTGSLTAGGDVAMENRQRHAVEPLRPSIPILPVSAEAPVALDRGVSGSIAPVAMPLTPVTTTGISVQPLAEAERPHPSVARIVAFDNKGQQYGSGTFLEEYGHYGIIITNWHVVEKADGLVHVHFPNRFGSYGAVIAIDPRWDLAAVAISLPPQSSPKMSLARTIPQPGEPLWIIGYGAGLYRMAGGRCLRYLAPEIAEGAVGEFECIELSVDARQGDSGGPILNANGEVAGVLFGSDQHNTAGSHCGRVALFLQIAMKKAATLPENPEDLFASIEKSGPRRRLIDSRKPILMATHDATLCTNLLPVAMLNSLAPTTSATSSAPAGH